MEFLPCSSHCYSTDSPSNPISDQLWFQSLLIELYLSSSPLPSPVETFQYSGTLLQGPEVSF